MIDLAGGLSDELEFVFADQPDDPEMRESVKFLDLGRRRGVRPSKDRSRSCRGKMGHA